MPERQQPLSLRSRRSRLNTPCRPLLARITPIHCLPAGPPEASLLAGRAAGSWQLAGQAPPQRFLAASGQLIGLDLLLAQTSW